MSRLFPIVNFDVISLADANRCLIVLLIGIYQITDLVFDRLERLERVQQGTEVKRGE